jgi:hypothetical protein
MPYRRSIDNVELWHFCTNCSKWPSEKYLWLLDLLSTDLICSECKERKLRGECVEENRS